MDALEAFGFERFCIQSVLVLLLDSFFRIKCKGNIVS